MSTQEMYLNKFLQEHPSFSKVDSLAEEDKEKVLWAADNGYARVELAPGDVQVVSKHQLTKAKMWWEKMHG